VSIGGSGEGRYIWPAQVSMASGGPGL